MPAPYTASAIGKWFLGSIDRHSGDSITHLKLQKLIYYAQAWSLAIPERSAPLFDEDLQAWAHGPVAESVFQEYRGSSWDALPPPEASPEIAEADEAHLQEILSVYGDFSAKHLERMSHNELPWKDARGDMSPAERSNTIIPKEHMAAFYRGLLEQVEDGAE